MDYGNTDNTTPIFYSLTTRPYTLDGLFSTRKHISKMAIIHKGMEGAAISYGVDNDHISDLKHLTQIESRIARPFSCDIKGNQVWFNAKGSSVGEPFEYQGMEILESSSEIIG